MEERQQFVAVWMNLEHPILFPPSSGKISIHLRAFYEMEKEGKFVVALRVPTEKLLKKDPLPSDLTFTLGEENFYLFKVGMLAEAITDSLTRTFSSYVGVDADINSFFIINKIELSPVSIYALAEGKVIPLVFEKDEEWWVGVLNNLMEMLSKTEARAKEIAKMMGLNVPYISPQPIDELGGYRKAFSALFSACVHSSFGIAPQLFFNTLRTIIGIGEDTGSVQAEVLFPYMQDMAEHIVAYGEQVYEIVSKMAADESKNAKLAILHRLRDEADEVISSLTGEGRPFSNEEYAKQLLEEAKSRDLPSEVKNYITNEISRILAAPNALSMWVEANVTLKHISFLLSLPWDRVAEEEPDLALAEKLLNERFHGMRAAKQKILDYIATIRHLKSSSLKGTVLCFLGVPGTGKTDVSRTIAEALRRPFFRIPLGGVDDEAVIKGHRRTYVGAMPGNIMRALAEVGVKNPVILLDEVDKLGMGLRGDPAAALLDALDPDHNHNFFDHYVDFPFDLSNVLFICAANVWENIHPTLRDRMEVVEFPPYTPSDKIIIAKRYLLPRWLKELNLPKDEVKISDDAILRLVKEYTFEGGVRNLNNLLKIILQRRLRGITPKKVTEKEIPKILWDIAPAHRGKRREHLPPGVAPVLGVFPNTGEGELSYIEILRVGKEQETEWLLSCDDVFKRSFHSARVLVEKMFPAWKLANAHFVVYKTMPASSIGGTSAGLSIAFALYSLLSSKSLPSTVAYSGEISPSGDIYPVGGIAAKVVLAETAGFTDLILPEDNRVEVSLLDFTPTIRIHFVKRFEEALAIVQSHGGA